MAKIKLVAVDEDGTFMRDHVSYDVERFERIFACMKERGIRFVVATGNQCYWYRLRQRRLCARRTGAGLCG